MPTQVHFLMYKYIVYIADVKQFSNTVFSDVLLSYNFQKIYFIGLHVADVYIVLFRVSGVQGREESRPTNVQRCLPSDRVGRW